MTISTPKRLGALALRRGLRLRRLLQRREPRRRAPPQRRARAPRRARRPAPITHRRLEHRLPDHGGRRRGVPEGQPRRQGHRRVLRDRRRVQEVLQRRDRHQRRVAADQGRRRRAKAGLRGPTASTTSSSQVAIDGLTVVVNPAEHLGRLPHDRRSSRRSTDPDSPEHVPGRTSTRLAGRGRSSRSCPGADSGTFDYFTEVDQRQGRRRATSRLHPVRGRQHPRHRASPATRTPSATSASPTTRRTQDKLKVVADRRRRAAASRPTDETINDGTYTPLQPAAVHLPDTVKAPRRARARRPSSSYYLANVNTLSSTEVGYVDASPTTLAEAEQRPTGTAAVAAVARPHPSGAPARRSDRPVRRSCSGDWRAID